jgi:hypothetical protein
MPIAVREMRIIGETPLWIAAAPAPWLSQGRAGTVDWEQADE